MLPILFPWDFRYANISVMGRQYGSMKRHKGNNQTKGMAILYRRPARQDR